MKNTLIALALAAAPVWAGTVYVDSSTTLYTLDTTTNTLTAASSYSFQGARGITQGANGNIYVADYSAGKIIQIDNAGNGSVFASLSGVYGLAASGAGIIASNFSGAGALTTFDSMGTQTGSIATGYTGEADLVYGPNGDLYFGAQSAHAVIDYNGSTFTSVADLSGDSFNPGTGQSAATPRGIVFDNGEMFVADSASIGGSGSGIYAFGASAGIITTAGGAKGLALVGSTLYFTDTINGGVYKTGEALNSGASLVASLTGAQDIYVASSSATPEPGTIAMMFGGLSMVVAGYRKRARR